MNEITLETLSSLCKRRGFIYQGSEIYGGLAGTWDYGPLGLALKRNITNLWWETFVDSQDNVYGIDSTIIMSPKVWEASGHTTTFNDPAVEDTVNKKQHRLDHLLEDNGINPEGMSIEDMAKVVSDKSIKSPDGNPLGTPTNMNQMFKTHVGFVEDESSLVYLRPETAQGMFVNFKNIIDSFYPDLPFGLAQMGRNFRNEISPRDFIFRVREFEIMEIEVFIDPQNWESEFKKYQDLMQDWFVNKLHLSADNIHNREISEADRAHYSKRTIDFEYNFPIGIKEIAGLAYRTDFDLKSHQEHSGKSMEYNPKGTDKRFIPHVIEPTFGIDRHVLAVLSEAYKEDEINGEKRAFLALPFDLAPVKLAVSPLLKNKPELVNKAREIYKRLQAEFKAVMWDDNGNIGKRYRRQDEIGTPYCVTIDFDTLSDGTVTLRERDTTNQTRKSVDDLIQEIKNK